MDLIKSYSLSFGTFCFSEFSYGIIMMKVAMLKVMHCEIEEYLDNFEESYLYPFYQKFLEIPSLSSFYLFMGEVHWDFHTTETFLPDAFKTKTNATRSAATSVTDASNAASNLLLRKKFAKKGRTISSTITNSYNESNASGSQYTDQFIYGTNGILLKDSILDQHNIRKGNTLTYSANVVYTEPLGKKSLLEFNTFLSQSIGKTSKKVYDKNTSSALYDQLNTRLTNEFNSDYIYSGGGMNFRTNQRKYNFSTGFSLQNARLTGENVTTNTKLNQVFSRHFTFCDVSI